VVVASVVSAVRDAAPGRGPRRVAPGCNRPPVACDAHHLRHWVDGGATALDNLVLLCRAHHTTVHATPWQVRLRRDDRRPESLPPPGRYRDPLPVRHRPLRT
jgi:hypothetical protein